MSNRIKELAKEAYISDAQKNNQNWKFTEITDHLLDSLDGFNQKFAELIILECISVAENQRNPSTLNYKPSERFVEELKYHFGVK